MFPSRFALKKFEVFFARPTADREAWKTVLDALEARFGNTHKKPFYLNAGDPVYKAVCELVPWDIARMQAAWTPQARRLPQEFPYTHRGAAMRLTDGELALEAEDLGAVSFPKRSGSRSFSMASRRRPTSQPRLPKSCRDALPAEFRFPAWTRRSGLRARSSRNSRRR